MASDNHAHYARIGFLVVAGFFAIAATLAYLGGLKGRHDEIFAETYSEKPVSGLSVGSTVNFRGVKVGEVRKISFVGSEYDVRGIANHQICILMAFKKDLLGLRGDSTADDAFDSSMKKGLRATVTASGITGLSRIELDFASAGASTPPELSWTPRHKYIPLAPSLLDNFSDTATRVVNEIDKLDFTTIRRNVSETMSHSANAVSNISDLAAGAAALVDSGRERLEAVLEELRLAASSVRNFADRISDDPSLLVMPPKSDPLPETR